MRITSSQLRRIIMEEVANAKRQKRIQEARARRRKTNESRARQTRLRRRRMNETFNNVFNPKIGLAGAILVGLITAAGIVKSFSEESQQNKAEIQNLATQACEIAAEKGGDSCNPELAIQQALEHFEEASNVEMSFDPDQTYGSPEFEPISGN